MQDKKKILIIDDDGINRKILNKILSNEYEVAEAENGLAALELLKSENKKTDLILLDIVMPVMDGFAFLNERKKETALSEIPVIVATQKSDEETEFDALNNGAIGVKITGKRYLNKT